jgi:hypothetical protein
MSFPNNTTTLLRLFGSLSLATLQGIPWRCFSSTLSIPLDLQMQLNTLLPLLVMAVIVFFYALVFEMQFIKPLATESEGDAQNNKVNLRRMRSNTRRQATFRRKSQQALLLRCCSLLSMLYFLSLSGVSSLLFSSLACVSLATSEQSSSSHNEATVLWNDVSVQCNGTAYNIVVVWSAIAIAVYFLLCPLLNIAFLFVFRADIQTQFEHELAGKISTKPSSKPMFEVFSILFEVSGDIVSAAWLCFCHPCACIRVIAPKLCFGSLWNCCSGSCK